MDKFSRSVETINIANIQYDYRTEDVNRLHHRFPATPAEKDEDYDKYHEMTLNIRRKKDDITNFSQALNYVLVHATQPGSEAHSMVRRIMRQSNGFEAWRQFTLQYAGGHRAQQCFTMQLSWDSTTWTISWSGTHYVKRKQAMRTAW
eukprot:534751-Amphidinium_carterae.1